VGEKRKMATGRMIGDFNSRPAALRTRATFV
jgi:hypothetical protein